MHFNTLFHPLNNNFQFLNTRHINEESFNSVVVINLAATVAGDIKFDSGVPKISTLLDQPLKLWISTNKKIERDPRGKFLY